MKAIIGDSLLIGAGVFLLYHFILFWLYGWIQVGEPNMIIRALETILCLAIIGLGVERFYNDLRRSSGH